MRSPIWGWVSEHGWWGAVKVSTKQYFEAVHSVPIERWRRSAHQGAPVHICTALRPLIVNARGAANTFQNQSERWVSSAKRVRVWMDESDAAEGRGVGSRSETDDGIGENDCSFVVTRLVSSAFPGLHSVLGLGGWAELGMEPGPSFLETESKIGGAVSMIDGEASAELRQNENWR